VKPTTDWRRKGSGNRVGGKGCSRLHELRDGEVWKKTNIRKDKNQVNDKKAKKGYREDLKNYRVTD